MTSKPVVVGSMERNHHDSCDRRGSEALGRPMHRNQLNFHALLGFDNAYEILRLNSHLFSLSFSEEDRFSFTFKMALYKLLTKLMERGAMSMMKYLGESPAFHKFVKDTNKSVLLPPLRTSSFRTVLETFKKGGTSEQVKNAFANQSSKLKSKTTKSAPKNPQSEKIAQTDPYWEVRCLHLIP